MGFSLISQELIFAYACIFGLLLGALYDVFRIVRLLLDAGEKQLFFLDVFYFFCCGIFTFLFTLVYNCGEIRFYILAGEMIGWCVYHLTLGQLTFYCSTALASALRRLFGWFRKRIFSPFFRAVRHFLAFLLNLLKKRIRLPKKSKKNSKINLKHSSKIVYNSNKRFREPDHKKRPGQKHGSKKGR